MLEKQYFTRKPTTDLRMVNCGMEQCLPGHRWGPGVRDHYLLHIVFSGKGVFHINRNKYEISGNSGFLITPDTIAEYAADNSDPWCYGWVGFDGISSASLMKKAKLSLNSPIFRSDKSFNLKVYIDQMLDCDNSSPGKDEKLMSLLYGFISELININENSNISSYSSFREEYVKSAVEYIRNNYSERLTVKNLSEYIGLDRSYLYSLFKKYLQQSPKEYITTVRMSKAMELMDSVLTIREIAYSVGYEDALLFSKNFKTHTGLSPSRYRKDKLPQLKS